MMSPLKRVTIAVALITLSLLALAVDWVWFGFATFSVRAKEAQCEVVLEQLLNDVHRLDAGAPLAFPPLKVGRSRYGYFAGPEVRADGGDYFPPDTTKYAPRTVWTGPFPLPSGAVPGRSDAGVVLVCAGDIDADEGIALWSIADYPRTVGRFEVPAGDLLHEVEDAPQYRLPWVRWLGPPPPLDKVVLSVEKAPSRK
ncbi:MAG: hypothetical protein AB1938_23195 [Myxococcota bacterium]